MGPAHAMAVTLSTRETRSSVHFDTEILSLLTHRSFKLV